MANLTITIEDDLLRRARIRALEQGTSINALLREYLLAYTGRDSVQEEALRRLLDISATCSSGRGGASWTRDDLHQR